MHVLEEGEMLYPIAAELENVHEPIDGEIASGSDLLALTALAEEASVWDAEEAYDQVEESPKYASQSFVPSGLFGERPEDIEPRAFLTGTVKEAATLHNEVTGGPFVHAMVATYGATVDCVFSPGDLPNGLLPGNVVQGEFWLMGRLLPAP
jgi:hypothetical protein